MEKRGRLAKVEKVEVVDEGEKAELVKQKRKPRVKGKGGGAAGEGRGAVEGKPGKKFGNSFFFIVQRAMGMMLWVVWGGGQIT